MTVRYKVGLAATILLVVTATASAEPVLQLYLEGGTYDPTSESWVVQGSGESVRLWVIGQSPISNVKLSVAYSASATPAISLAGSTTGGFGGFTDPSAPADPTLIQTVTDGSSPVLSSGSSLPSHGVYRDGVAWQEFALGDFTLNDSPIADFIDSLPAPGNKTGQINVYEVSVSGAVPIHFDVYNGIAGARGGVFAPFSHDAGTGTVPAPAAVLLALIGMGATSLLRRYLV